LASTLPEAVSSMRRSPVNTQHAIDTVFLDRDGVINRRLPADYIKRWDDFEFLPGVVDALRELRLAGLRTIVITNQRGIARGLFTLHDLELLHAKMQEELARSHATVDAIYVCPDLEGPRRKPAPGMLLDARRDYPAIDFTRSVLIGDFATDMQAADAAGCRGILVGEGDHLAAQLATLRTLGIVPVHVARDLPDALRSWAPLAASMRSREP